MNPNPNPTEPNNICERTTFAPATIIVPMIYTNVKRNPNPKLNPNLNPNINPYPTPNQKPNHYPHSKILLSEISSSDQLSPEQMSDHRFHQIYCWHVGLPTFNSHWRTGGGGACPPPPPPPPPINLNHVLFSNPYKLTHIVHVVKSKFPS